MKDESDLKAIINSLRKYNDELLAGMRELEQENMDKEDENGRLLQQLLVAREDTYVAIDAERLRAWNENKAFQYDLAEQNAELRKQLAGMADMEQQIIDLEQLVEFVESERNYWKELSDDRSLVSADVTKAVDAERLRASNENKAFQWELALCEVDLAEQNAELRKQLAEKHDDNCRLLDELAEEHNKLLDAPEASDITDLKRRMNQFENGDISSLLEADLERLTSMVDTLWEERYDS